MLLAGAALLLAEAWFFSKYFFRVKQFRIGKEKAGRRFRILLLTDLHFKRRFWPFHQRLVERINELRPHLILCAGDLIDVTGTKGPAEAFLRRLNPATPKLFIPGNHDHRSGVGRGALRRMLEQNNGRLLVNETAQLRLDGVPFTITGLDDFLEGESCFADAVREVGKEPHHLLLVHSPLQQDLVLKELGQLNSERTADRQLDLQYIFAGHTHGGQVRLFHYLPGPPRHAGRYLQGWYNRHKPYLYVSNGFGTARLPFRFGARSEITVFDYGV